MAKTKLSPVPPVAQETKHERFRRLAPKRMGFALKPLRRVGNLFSSGYEWTPEERDQMLTALRAEFDFIEHKSREKPSSDKPIFEFS